MMVGTVIWGVAALAALGVAAALAFYATAGRPLSPEMADRVAANAPELHRQAATLGGRPVWKLDVGLVVGATLFLLGLAAAGPAYPYAAAGASLALVSLTGRLLILGGRRRIDQIRRALN